MHCISTDGVLISRRGNSLSLSSKTCNLSDLQLLQRKENMAKSSALPPLRSISLPSRLPPACLRIEQGLEKLRKWEVSTVSEAGTIQVGLIWLTELFNCVDELIHSPSTHQALLGHQGGEAVEMALNESVTMLDACSTAKDVLLLMKAQVHVLQSALRRKGAESSIQTYLGDYISFRKKVGKEISRSIRTLKQAQKKIGLSAILFQHQHLSEVMKMLREVTSVSISVLRSLTLFLSSPVLKTKIGGCSMISRVISVGFLPCEKEKKILNEVARVDAAIRGLHQQAKTNDLKFEVQTVQRKLESMALCMDELEVEMGCIYKCLIKYRVSLLNVLNCK